MSNVAPPLHGAQGRRTQRNKQGKSTAVLTARDAKVEVPIMMDDPVEHSGDQRVLLTNLGNIWALGELQRLGPAVRERTRRSEQRLPLMHAVPKGNHILPLGRLCQILEPVNADDLIGESAQLPIEWGRTLGTLISRSRRQYLDAFQSRQKTWHEFLATELDPSAFGVGHEDDR
eukprot:CAMPEP_0198513860 /NCGR_PEP_ID=MMETSP1462-20131121/16331_1 /TAXON_ID=1333877 /ORGANISM="Brandtodinium nutriculum, Strain RCC3387" /LENGTH=173 /DNA_ID=CAMNT_0044243289 /DNA_START=13 /DNA_END=531 /DNA_ORIENTATION=-